jgi:hypothetical protein
MVPDCFVFQVYVFSVTLSFILGLILTVTLALLGVVIWKLTQVVSDARISLLPASRPEYVKSRQTSVEPCGVDQGLRKTDWYHDLSSDISQSCQSTECTLEIQKST